MVENGRNQREDSRLIKKMGKVQLLPDQVANQIAAGEVVERPASVVKELVENSLDAGATQIEVEIQAGGRNLIRVTDNGSGMERDDALMSLERHATSKLTNASDLITLGSFGFRGEAIPSIASVSLFQLTTSMKGHDSATQILVDGGKILSVKEAGHPTGTSIEVRQLFFNVPARKKFLRSAETEKAHIQEYILLVALSHPEVAINYIQDHKRVYQLPAIPDGKSMPEQLSALKKRWKQLHSSSNELIEVYHESSMPITHPNEQAEDACGDKNRKKSWLMIWGLIGKPGISRSTRTDQHLFVNRRPVENKVLNTAILEGYHTAMPKGRYPVGCLFIEMDPSEVDINIHPAKKEIKFQRERGVRNVCSDAVREALFEFATGNDESAEKKLEAKPVMGNESERTIPLPDLSAIPKDYQPEMISASTDPDTEVESPSSTNTPDPQPSSDSAGAGVGAPGPDKAITSKANKPVGPDESKSDISSPEPTLKVPLKTLGMVGKNFILMESERGLVLMDQRAARARIIYERLLKSLEQEASSSQRLLLPETFELSSKDAAVLRENLDPLNKMGVEIREFGDKAFVLEALPPVVKSSDARRFTVELIDRIRLGGTGNHTWDFGEESLAKEMAFQAIHQNGDLDESEVHIIVRDLRYCRMPYTSPDGRPTLIEFSFSELDRKFGIRS